MVITAVLGVVMGILVGLVGFWLRQNTKLSIVEISAWLTLGAGLILPRLGSDGFLLGLICTSVSYVVMSSRERISTRKEMVIVSATCALVVYYGQNVLVGIGGRLGTFAALSVLFFNLARDYLKRRYDHDYGNNYS